MPDDSSQCAMSGCANTATITLRGSKGNTQWRDYLVDERGASPPVLGLVIPLCEEHSRLSVMRDSYERSPLHDDVTAILDRINTDLLLDDDGIVG